MKRLLPLLLAAAAAPVLAHTGTEPHVHTAALQEGLLHPVTGLDHLLMLLGTGVLAAVTGRSLLLPLATLAVLTGLVLYIGFGIGMGAGWMHVKLTCVLLLIGYHHGCGRLLRKFADGQRSHSERWFRVFNEGPVILLLIVVAMVIIKPF